MIKNSYEFEILVNGNPVKEYSHEGRIYIEGKKGTRYSLRFRNNTSKRVLFIPSVDGLNALNGKRATEKDTGYIVDAYSSNTIDGWRTSDKEIAEFFFSTPEDSYAERKGKGQNVGVLGCAVVKEIEKPKEVIKYIHDTVYIHDHHHHCDCWKCNPYTTSNSGLDSSMTTSGQAQVKASSMNMNDVSHKNMSMQELGTGWGDKKYSEVIKVDFERESYPTETFEIFYNTRKQLQSVGVDLNKKVQYIAPSAFKQSGEYCEEPEN